ncbi:MAG: hypothetical protein LBK99_00510 [Opitutaceae bacterium]|nr:hypothetical protein [Opitutaceae bacterium]
MVRRPRRASVQIIKKVTYLCRRIIVGKRRVEFLPETFFGHVDIFEIGVVAAECDVFEVFWCVHLWWRGVKCGGGASLIRFDARLDAPPLATGRKVFIRVSNARLYSRGGVNRRENAGTDRRRNGRRYPSPKADAHGGTPRFASFRRATVFWAEMSAYARRPGAVLASLRLQPSRAASGETAAVFRLRSTPVAPGLRADRNPCPE